MAKKKLLAAEDKIKELEDQLAQHAQELSSKDKEIENERKAFVDLRASKEAAELQTKQVTDDLNRINQNKAKLEQELKSSKTNADKVRQEKEAQQKKVEAELAKTKAEKEQQVKKLQEDVRARESTVSSLSNEKNQLAAEKTKLQSDMQRQMEEAKKKQSEIQATLQKELQNVNDTYSAKLKVKEEKEKESLVDIEISSCEFAKPFPYFITVQLGSGDKRRTDISAPSDRPVFANSKFLLPDTQAKDVYVSAYCVVNPGGQGEGSARELGSAVISIDGNSIERSINFVRKSGDKTVTVGRATVTVAYRLRGNDAYTPPVPIIQQQPSNDGLDKSLWMAYRFQCRLRVMLHHASAVPATFGKAEASVVVRLLRFDGSIAYESCSMDVPLTASEPLTVVSFNHEVVLPIKSHNLKEQRGQITLQVRSPESSVTELLSMSFFLSALQMLHPVHLVAEPSQGRVSSHARPLPTLTCSLTLEPLHHHLPSNKHGVEVRIDAVPLLRPLPEPISEALIAICPNWDSQTNKIDQGVLPKIPICTFNYDSKSYDLTTRLEHYYTDLVHEGLADQPYFITPVVSHGRTPNWNHFILRLALKKDRLNSLTAFLFDKNHARGHDLQAPLSDVFVGFTTLDLSPLIPNAGAEAMQRTFMSDLRLMDNPTASASLEVDCRVWPLEDGTSVAVAPAHSVRASYTSRGPSPLPPPMPNVAASLDGRSAFTDGRSTLADVGASILGNQPANNLRNMASPDPGGGASTQGGNRGAAPPSLRAATQEFQLNHDLSVQLMKEFNLRASALKSAGQEIVDLRRQIQVLTNENNKLKTQLEDEEKLAAQVRSNPPRDAGMFDSLSSAELSLRLQTALQKYRDEKTKSTEMSQRLEAALKEVARGRGLQKHLDQLETAHLEMAGLLQKLQGENAKIELYRKTAKSQEKVIAKLERVLEGSLHEVNKAQEAQIELEKLKTENIRMREKVAGLMARRKAEVGNEDVQELQDEVKRKEIEVKKLQDLVDNMQLGGSTVITSQKMEELQGEKLEWKQKCNLMESRLQTMEHQLVENSKTYGRELSGLKVQIAKKECNILQLQLRLGEDPIPT